MEFEQSASINEKSDEEIAKAYEERINKKKERNREYQRAWRQRQKMLKKKVSNEQKIEERRKRHRENQRAYYQRQKRLRENNYNNVEELFQKDDLQIKKEKLDSYEDQKNVLQCRASQNLENVQLEQNQVLAQQFRIYEESHECITPKVILHRTPDIPGDGNCLFHSLIRVLQLQISTCDLRRQLRDSPYLNSCHNPQEAYNILSSNNEYGDLDCLYLFAKMYNKNICVHYHYFNVISKNDDTRFCHFKANDTHNWIHLDLREQHFTPYFSDDEKKKEDERKLKQENKSASINEISDEEISKENETTYNHSTADQLDKKLLTIAVRKTKAQKQREYRRRIAASRTAAQALAARKWETERQRIYRQRKAANSALVGGSLESTTTSSSSEKSLVAKSNNVQIDTQQKLIHQKSDAERQRNCRQRKAANSALVSGSLESTTGSSSHSGARINDVQTQRQVTHQQRQRRTKAKPEQITVQRDAVINEDINDLFHIQLKADKACQTNLSINSNCIETTFSCNQSVIQIELAPKLLPINASNIKACENYKKTYADKATTTEYDSLTENVEFNDISLIKSEPITGIEEFTKTSIIKSEPMTMNQEFHEISTIKSEPIMENEEFNEISSIKSEPIMEYEEFNEISSIKSELTMENEEINEISSIKSEPITEIEEFTEFPIIISEPMTVNQKFNEISTKKSEPIIENEEFNEISSIKGKPIIENDTEISTIKREPMTVNQTFNEISTIKSENLIETEELLIHFDDKK